MKLIIAGGRNIPSNISHEKILQFFSALPFPVEEIVSGGARGVDTAAREIAHHLKIKFTEFPANWDVYGKSAGAMRNRAMGQYSDALLLIWDGKSRGSANMKSFMESSKKPIYEAIIVF